MWYIASVNISGILCIILIRVCIFYRLHGLSPGKGEKTGSSQRSSQAILGSTWETKPLGSSSLRVSGGDGGEESTPRSSLQRLPLAGRRFEEEAHHGRVTPLAPSSATIASRSARAPLPASRSTIPFSGRSTRARMRSPTS